MPKPKVSFAICPKPLLQRGLRSHRHVISSYGRGGLSAAILGREANEVLTHTKTPLWCIAEYAARRKDNSENNRNGRMDDAASASAYWPAEQPFMDPTTGFLRLFAQGDKLRSSAHE